MSAVTPGTKTLVPKECQAGSSITNQASPSSSPIFKAVQAFIAGANGSLPLTSAWDVKPTPCEPACQSGTCVKVGVPLGCLEVHSARVCWLRGRMSWFVVWFVMLWQLPVVPEPDAVLPLLRCCGVRCRVPVCAMLAGRVLPVTPPLLAPMSATASLVWVLRASLTGPTAGHLLTS